MYSGIADRLSKEMITAAPSAMADSAAPRVSRRASLSRDSRRAAAAPYMNKRSSSSSIASGGSTGLTAYANSSLSFSEDRSFLYR